MENVDLSRGHLRRLHLLQMFLGHGPAEAVDRARQAYDFVYGEETEPPVLRNSEAAPNLHLVLKQKPDSLAPVEQSAEERSESPVTEPSDAPQPTVNDDAQRVDSAASSRRQNGELTPRRQACLDALRDLAAIDGQWHPVPQARLTKRMGCAPGTVSALCEALERIGLIEIRRDGRAVSYVPVGEPPATPAALAPVEPAAVVQEPAVPVVEPQPALPGRMTKRDEEAAIAAHIAQHGVTREVDLGVDGPAILYLRSCGCDVDKLPSSSGRPYRVNQGSAITAAELWFRAKQEAIRRGDPEPKKAR